MVRHDAGPRIKDSLLGFSVSRKDLVAPLHQLYATIGNRFWKWSKDHHHKARGPDGTFTCCRITIPANSVLSFFPLVSCKER